MACTPVNHHDGTPRHVWRVYKSSGKTHKNQNACIDALKAEIFLPSETNAVRLYTYMYVHVHANSVKHQGKLLAKMLYMYMQVFRLLVFIIAHESTKSVHL